MGTPQVKCLLENRDQRDTTQATTYCLEDPDPRPGTMESLFLNSASPFRVTRSSLGNLDLATHLNASLMDQLRVPDKVRQERLGHLDFNDVTLSIYSHSESRQCRVSREGQYFLRNSRFRNFPVPVFGKLVTNSTDFGHL
jgi:hypothetical protein